TRDRRLGHIGYGVERYFADVFQPVREAAETGTQNQCDAWPALAGRFDELRVIGRHGDERMKIWRARSPLAPREESPSRTLRVAFLSRSERATSGVGQRRQFELGRLHNQLGAAILAEQAAVEDEVVLVDIGRLAM